MTLSFETFPPCTSSDYLTSNYYHRQFGDRSYFESIPYTHTTQYQHNNSIIQWRQPSQPISTFQTRPHQSHEQSSSPLDHSQQHLHNLQGVRPVIASNLPHQASPYRSGSTSDRLHATLFTGHQMYASTPSTVGNATVQQGKGLKRSRSHQRTPSASTVASNGPNSPFVSAAPYTHIVQSDGFSSDSPISFIDQNFSKALPTPSQTPLDGSFAPSKLPSNMVQLPHTNLAMRDFALQHHADLEQQPDMIASRQSTISSHGNDSPATPHSGPDDMDVRAFNTLQQDVKHSNPNMLFRSDSQQAYQDELYSPYTAYASPSVSKPQSSTFLSPHHMRMAEALRHANQQRARSPAAARERSPYREDSEFVNSQGWQSSMPSGGSAAQLRQRQKEQAEQAELARTRPNLQREATKTISPKDALLDSHENMEHTPLFPVDTLPAGYETHRGGVEQWPNNIHMFGGMAPSSQSDMTFADATPGESTYAQANLNFPPLPQPSSDSINNTSFPANYASAMPAPKLEHFDSPPHFPAPLPSMETSNSDTGYGFSSQEEPSSKPQRPADTRANTGAYTCTYHDCRKRFDSQPHLAQHKRDAHRAQQTTPGPTESVSARSTESPAPVGTGMTSAAILARNSQAGPHKCERINPSTGKPCNTIFSRPYDLTRHEDTIHNNRKHKVRCQYCREEKTFSRTDALTRHMRVVHPEMEAMGKRGRRGD